MLLLSFFVVHGTTAQSLEESGTRLECQPGHRVLLYVYVSDTKGDCPLF